MWYKEFLKTIKLLWCVGLVSRIGVNKAYYKFDEDRSCYLWIILSLFFNYSFIWLASGCNSPHFIWALCLSIALSFLANYFWVYFGCSCVNSYISNFYESCNQYTKWKYCKLGFSKKRFFSYFCGSSSTNWWSITSDFPLYSFTTTSIPSSIRWLWTLYIATSPFISSEF